MRRWAIEEGFNDLKKTPDRMPAGRSLGVLGWRFTVGRNDLRDPPAGLQDNLAHHLRLPKSTSAISPCQSNLFLFAFRSPKQFVWFDIAKEAVVIEDIIGRDKSQVLVLIFPNNDKVIRNLWLRFEWDRRNGGV